MPEKRGPWTVLKKNVIYRDPWIEVRKDDVIRPEGSKGTYSMVTAKHGVSVLPIDDKGNVYLVREFKYALGKYSISTSSGGIEGSEPPLKAAKRELAEELGIKAKRWKYLGKINPFTTFVFSEAHLFLAQGLELGQPKNDDGEIIEMVKVKFEKAVEMVLNNKIDHSPSAILILKAKEYLKDK
ncbi:MAG TPA: NUDIX hydrolase [archaeon]|nr:NUDIX hydrolase [archaeon]